MVGYLSQRGNDQLSFLAGETVNLQLSPQQQVSSYALKMPNGESVRRTLPPGESAIRISTTGDLGNYRVASGGQTRQLDMGFSINATEEISELQRVDAKVLVKSFPKNQVELATNLDDVERYVDIGRSGRELFPWAITLVALVWGAEHSAGEPLLQGGAVSSWGVNPIGGTTFLVVIAALLLAALMVGPSRKKIPLRRRVLLTVLRAASALILLLVMLRPTLVSIETRKQPGTLIMLADSSRSMQIGDSIGDAPRWDALKATLSESQDTLAELAETWDLKLYEFDQDTRPLTIENGTAQLSDVPDGPQSALGSALDDVLQRESQQRIVAVLLMSDGAQRAFAPRDVPPQTVARRMAVDQIPLYTFTYGKPALGLQSDLRVDDLLANDVVFAETPANVQVTVGADGYTNQTFKVQLLWESAEGEMEVVDTRQILVKESRRRVPVTLTHTPMVPGEYKLTVQIESPEGELATTNNQQSTFVTVLKGGVNVLYLVGSARIGGGPGIEPRFVRAALAPHADINLRYDLLNYRRQRINIRQQLRDGKYDVYLLGNLDVTALDKSSWRQMAEDVDRGAGLAMLGGYHSFGPGGFRGSDLERVLPLSFGMAERQNFGEPTAAGRSSSRTSAILAGGASRSDPPHPADKRRPRGPVRLEHPTAPTGSQPTGAHETQAQRPSGGGDRRCTALATHDHWCMGKR